MFNPSFLAAGLLAFCLVPTGAVSHAARRDKIADDISVRDLERIENMLDGYAFASRGLEPTDYDSFLEYARRTDDGVKKTSSTVKKTSSSSSKVDSTAGEAKSSGSKINIKTGSTQVIGAFPGTGKTYLEQKLGNKILDMDAKHFLYFDHTKPGVGDNRNPAWPGNYIEAIQKEMKKKDAPLAILIVQQTQVLNLLDKAKIKYSVVAPTVDQKADYMARWTAPGRENPPTFMKTMENGWEKFIGQIKEKETGNPGLGTYIWLKDSKTFLSSVVELGQSKH